MTLATLLALSLVSTSPLPARASINSGWARAPIRRALPELRSCHARARRPGNACRGRITVHFAVDPRGGVTVEDLRDTTGCPALVQCVGEVFSRMVYSPPPQELIRITYPLRFD
jgi:outer membrane biosynthesis protein TonB